MLFRSALRFLAVSRVIRFGGESCCWGGEWSSLRVEEEGDLDADCLGIGVVSLAGEELCLEEEEWWRGVTVMAMEVEGVAEDSGSTSWGGSTDAGVA